MSEVRVQDHPDLRKRGAGVVNVNDREYHLALARRRGAAENERLRTRVTTLEKQIALILEQLKG